jgi:hypothetical protein
MGIINEKHTGKNRTVMKNRRKMSNNNQRSVKQIAMHTAAQLQKTIIEFEISRNSQAQSESKKRETSKPQNRETEKKVKRESNSVRDA